MDTREDIIARLFAVVSGVADFETAERNRIDFDDTQLPAVSVLEGDEEALAGQLVRGSRPHVVTASPQVFLRVSASDAGLVLNTLRAAIIKAVLADTELIALSLNHGGVRYAGMQTAIHVARNVMGAATLLFDIKYMMYPDRL